MQDHTQALREALQGFLDFHTKPAGISVELITEKELFSQAMADIGKREDDLIAAARAALSHHEDGGRAEPVWCSCGDAIMPDTGAKCGVCASGVALGGEKGEAVAWQWQTEDGQVGFIDPWQKESGWEQANPRAKLIRPLFAAPVGKARMLTDEEADHITGMHNTGRSQGDSECAEAIQRKFCEVNGIRLAGGNKGDV